jgi:A/G-specific adenine glycosylase
MKKYPWHDLLKWSQDQHHHLPWRKNRTLYGTLVSEIMLQQTTVSTVLGKFEAFCRRFPTFEKLACASDAEIQIEWKGLGYYRRARNLKRAAEWIMERGGEIPMSFEELCLIPGVGDYTASALMAIGRDQKAIAIDANLERVLARVAGVREKKGPRLQRELRARFEQGELLPEVQSYRALNEALMDLGRVYCQARRAHCSLCPLQSVCVAYNSGSPLAFPVADDKPKIKHELSLVRIVVKRGEKILGFQKTPEQWLAGQIELPTFILSTTDPTLTQYPKASAKLVRKAQKGIQFSTSITKYKITNMVLKLSRPEFDRLLGGKGTKCYRYVLCDPDKENLATSVLKTLKALKK